MAEQNIQMKYWNGAEWVIQYPRTKASLVAETTDRVFLTPTQRTAVNDYLSRFNEGNTLLKLDATGKIPSGHITEDFEDYVKKDGSTTMTGRLLTPSIRLTSSSSNRPSTLSADDTTGLKISHQGTGKSASITLQADGDIHMGSSVVKGVANPTAGTDAANKEYVDNLVSGGFKVKDPVKAASTAPITITAALNALDGHALEVGNRVLIKDQDNAAQNGVYVLNSSKIPQKNPDDSALGSAVFVENGSTQNDYIYVHSTENSWKLFARPDTVQAGAGLEKASSTVIRVKQGGITNGMLVGDIGLSKLETFTSDDSNTAPNTKSANTKQSLASHIINLYSILRLAKGTLSVNSTTNYNLSTIPALVETKSKVYSGTDAVPTGANFNKGDLYIQVME